jgi:DNA-binding response OmpR family regulator
MNAPGGPLVGLTILVIVVDFVSIESLIGSLRSVGAVVGVVGSTAVALAYSEQHPVDVVLVDLREPDWWSTPEIRALRSLTRVPIYALTEITDRMLHPSAEIAGYFPKPVPVEALIAMLSALPRRTR